MNQQSNFSSEDDYEIIPNLSSDFSSEKESIFSLILGSVIVVGLILLVLFGMGELLTWMIELWINVLS